MNMFWFIYTTFSAERGLFYDGNEYNLKYCSDPKSAKTWREENQDKMQDISVKLYWTRTIKLKIPIVDADTIEDSNDIIDWADKHKINTINSQLISQILDKYICSDEWIFAIRDVVRQELVSWVKMNMRDVIEWIFRVSDLKIITWEDKDTKKKQYMEVPLGQDVDVTYKSRKINLKWIYAPAIRKMMFPDSNFKGSTLQGRQQDALYKRGLYTFIIWAREAWKCERIGSRSRLYDGTFKNVEDLVVWDKLLASDKKSFTTVYATERKRDRLLKITLNTGQELFCTPEHKRPTSASYRWGKFNSDITTQAKDIQVGTFIPTILWVEFSWWNMQEIEECRLLWYVLWDGSCGYTGFDMTKKSIPESDKIMKMVENCWMTCHKSKDKILIQKGKEFRDKYDLKHKSASKYIPNFIFWYSNKHKAALVEWMLNTDGCINIKKNWCVVIEYCSISEKLIIWLHTLLNDLWIINFYKKQVKNINLKTRQWEYEAYYLYISDTNSVKNLFSMCDLSGKKNFDKVCFNKEYSCSSKWVIPLESFEERSIEWKRNGRRIMRWWIRSPNYDYQREKAYLYWTEQWLNYQWSKVVSVEDWWEDYVVDIQVDWDHLYFDWTVLTHNSILSASITAQWILKEISNPTVEQLRWIQILYYWQSNDSNKRYYKYVKWLLQKISKNWNFIKFSDTAQTIQVFDWDISREIQFISQLSEAKGRWERPSLIIIDEAARIDEEVWKIAIGTTWVPIICISTVNYETRKNRFYDEFVKAEKQQRTYEPIDELIDDIWSKYKLDWEIQWGIERWVFARARDEFYERRPRIALRYTIDDIEPALMSEAQKKLKIENASQQWERFVMAEYYWFYVDDVDVFSYDGLMVSETPNTYDFVTVWYDPAQDYDFAWCTVVGVKDWICYILESKRLSSDPVLQLRELKEIREKYKSYIAGDRKYVNLWADITRWDWDLVIIEDRWIFVDYPIKFTSGKWISYNGRIHRPWKLYIIENIIRDQFFFKNNVKFPEYLAGDKWLLDEIASFRRVPTQSWQYTYKWVKSKDDLVFSMMIALYVAYCEWLREEYLRWDEEKQNRVWKLSDLVPKETNEVYNEMVTFWC